MEAELEKEIDKNLKKMDWPKQGEVKFNNVWMKYRPGLEPSIKGLDCKIQPGMKVGIVGRTGAGKSSILQALFRLVELDMEEKDKDGLIEIDGVNLAEVGLHQLRKNIAFIP